jgi:hypothetical protein
MFGGRTIAQPWFGRTKAATMVPTRAMTTIRLLIV